MPMGRLTSLTLTMICFSPRSGKLSLAQLEGLDGFLVHGIPGFLDQQPERLGRQDFIVARARDVEDRKSTRLNSSHQIISYAVFCLEKNKLETLRMSPAD